MRIARFAAGRDPQYGVVELAEDGGSHPDTVSVLTGDPIAMSVQLTGERKDSTVFACSLRLSRAARLSLSAATMPRTQPRWATKCRRSRSPSSSRTRR